MLAKISRVESEKTESKFRNRKRKLLSRVHVLHQAGAVKLGTGHYLSPGGVGGFWAKHDEI